MQEERHPADVACEELCPKLTVRQRTIGYVCTFIVGGILNLLSWTAIVRLVNGDPGSFVLLFIFGNLTQLSGTLFMRGPVSFGKKLISREMRIATVLYIVSMIALLVVCYVPGLDDGARLGLVILLLLVTYLCMAYFFICMIPFGKRIVDSFMTQYCGECKKKYCNCFAESVPSETSSPAQTPQQASNLRNIFSSN